MQIQICLSLTNLLCYEAIYEHQVLININNNNNNLT